MFRLSRKIAARTTGLAAAVLVMAPASAHTDGSHAMTMASGFAHPFLGFDHLLAMVAIGVWAAQHQRPASWLLPVVFPLVMVAGAIAGFAGLHVPGVEAGIAGSAAVLGLLIAFAVRLPVAVNASVVSVFALAHGYAHGAELPQGASMLLFGAGFVAATALLHLTGFAIGWAARKNMARNLVRVGGGCIAAAGAYLLAGVV